MMPARQPRPAISGRLLVILAFVLLLSAYVITFQHYFPLAGGTIGHDYSLAFPAMLDGNIWFRNNSLFTVPWFTPSFCAGQPAFADPQNSYFSLPQFLGFAFSPLGAIYVLLVICAVLVFWGGYLLMRVSFSSSRVAAVLVGGLLMFNGFLPHRLMIGHLNFHCLALTPWLALLLLAPARSLPTSVAYAVLGGGILAYWVHSSLGSLIPASALAIFLVALILAARPGVMTRFLARSAVAAAVGIALSAAKLFAAYSFLANFQRTYYALPGAASLPDVAAMIGAALFLPSQLAQEVGAPLLTNVDWFLLPHEWAFNFSIVLPPLIAVLAITRLRYFRLPVDPWHWLRWLLFALGLSWPLAFNYWSPEWHAFLKSVPILNTTSSALRWTIVYIPIIAIAAGLLVDRMRRGALWTVVACLVATVVQSAVEPREFYRAQGYEIFPVLLADARLREGAWKPRIAELGYASAVTEGGSLYPLMRNNTLIGGVSQIRCYNPIFGYRLEKFSMEGLASGPVLQVRGGHLNLKNPACYVFPVENGCRPGDRFRADQIDAAKAFIEYRPFPFNIPEGQRIANWVTSVTLALVAALLLAWGCWAALSARRGS